MICKNYIILGLLIYILLPIIYFILYFIYKYFVINIYNKIKSINRLYLIKKYSLSSWAVITGASSGIGKQLAFSLASKGFNICLIGSKNSINILEEISYHYRIKSNIKTHFIEKDFNNSQENLFFNDIETWIMNNDVSIIINNIGYRVSSLDFTKQSRKDIKNTINCGTLPQSIISQIAIKKFLKRDKKYKSTLINITAQCFTYNIGFGSMWSPIISVPYLSCYEGANAYGFFQGQSLYEEIKIKQKTDSRYKNINILNITPGPVITSKTKKSLSWIPFSCTDKVFANGIINLIDNFEGQQCAYWGHELSNCLMLFTPFFKKKILEKVGYNIAHYK
jgi:short-subunit dehydrogenase